MTFGLHLAFSTLNLRNVAGLKGRQEVWFDSTGEMTSFMAQTRRSLSQQSSFEFHVVLQYC
ncbi:hypothetical protein M422DRAFT_244184 [Sphaerobolus stellatus SS14]|nr:hypothetical protein M422DRAFT_244184 [Sphaerobolus stellatus SS14]